MAGRAAAQRFPTDERARGRATAEPAPAPPPHAVAQVLALQRTAGNAAVARALLQREMTEQQAAEKVKTLTTVVAGGGGVPITTDSQRSHFLRAGQEFFGSYDATINWFAAIRAAAVPGGIFLHDSAATRLEAVKAAMGTDMPKRGGGFQLRSEFNEKTRFSRLSHHTLGLAVDYDVTDMVRIGSARKELNAAGNPVETTHNADFLEAVTGSPSHADLTDGNRRALIKQMGDTTAAGGDASKVKGADQLLSNITSETDRMAQASADFQKSLGDQRDKFLELRNQYVGTKDPAEKKKIMEAVPAVVKPWLEAVENAERSLRATATAAGLDPDKLPSGDAVKAQGAARLKTAQAATDMGLRYKVAEGEEEKPLTDKDKPVLEAWEKEFKLPGTGTTLLRCGIRRDGRGRAGAQPRRGRRRRRQAQALRRPQEDAGLRSGVPVRHVDGQEGRHAVAGADGRVGLLHPREARGGARRPGQLRREVHPGDGEARLRRGLRLGRCRHRLDALRARDGQAGELRSLRRRAGRVPARGSRRAPGRRRGA